MEIIISKVESIQRCIKRVLEEYDNDPANLENFTKQDSIVLNLQRACELSIDMGNYIISKKSFKTPKTSRDVFEILADNSVIDTSLSVKLQKMTGFRNIAVHDYQRIDLNILKSIIENNIDDFRKLIEAVLEYLKK
ncbi:MAG: hypothetical protein CVV49_18765 [Spirochaetae bacterium HGW-Spirochaetae-5]|nr:MAG: hypothetical protein CVV49_18765 [Spirochaetae bacterium HGW-Spirochaetae-5]